MQQPSPGQAMMQQPSPGQAMSQAAGLRKAGHIAPYADSLGFAPAMQPHAAPPAAPLADPLGFPHMAD
eukprot:3094576-Prymnesium_polylepis.1